MKLIESKVELLEQEDFYKQIELAGRTCYKSEDKITEDSAEAFVDKMIKSGHTAMLEHGTIYLHIHWSGAVCQVCNQTLPSKVLDRYAMNPYSKVNYHGNDVYITTNMRVIQENSWLDDLKYLCEPTEYHERRISLKFVTDRGVSHELVRHRVFSFAQESTRYCNYSRDKFGNELTFIAPSWLNIHPGEYQMGTKEGNIEDAFTGNYVWLNTTTKETLFPQFAKYSDIFLNTMWNIERMYMELLKKTGSVEITPQQARMLLPNALKTEIVMTGFVSDWKHFFDLRLFGKTGKPHPDMLELCEKARKVLEEHDLWRLIYKPN